MSGTQNEFSFTGAVLTKRRRVGRQCLVSFMKATFFLRLSVVLALMLLIGGGRAQAQSLILSVTPSVTTNLVGSPLTYTINLTNQFNAGVNVVVTNMLSQNVVFTSDSITGIFAQSGFSTNSTTAVFSLTNFQYGGFAQMILIVIPTEAGTLTNSVTVATVPALLTPISTNVVTQVSFPQTDLSVTLTGPANSSFLSSSFFINDLLNYSLTVSNLGSNSVSGVLLTNMVPPAVKLISVSPANQAFTLTDNLMLFALSNMAGGSSQIIGLAIQPTNSGSFQLSASVGAPGFVDSNPANNFVTTSFMVSNFLSANFVVSNISTIAYDPQTGLMKQRVRLWNVGTNAVPSARVIVSGLTNLSPPITNSLYNAVGTNRRQSLRCLCRPARYESVCGPGPQVFHPHAPDQYQ